MDKHNSGQEQLWKSCPKGMLREVADRSTEQNRIRKGHTGSNQVDRRRMLQIAAAVAVTAGAGTIAYRSLFAPASSNGYGGISCATCIKNFEKHIQKALEEQMVAKMDKHLELCKSCRMKYDRMLTA